MATMTIRMIFDVNTRIDGFNAPLRSSLRWKNPEITMANQTNIAVTMTPCTTSQIEMLTVSVLNFWACIQRINGSS